MQTVRWFGEKGVLLVERWWFSRQMAQRCAI
jgi:hypothetical protein